MLIFFTVLLSLHPSRLAASETNISFPLDQIIEDSRKLALSDERSWKKLLFYAPRWFGRETSAVDSASYFFAEDGKHDPQAELEATIRAFYEAPTAGSDPEQWALCRFPARRQWLLDRLPRTPLHWQSLRCERFDEWFANHRYDKMSIVFSAYYSGNPASMLGHTFLRLHGRRADGSSRAALLDDIVNFSALMTSKNPFIYTPSGLFGWFEGKFSLMPYYIKIQEYNNAESRDLWEYELTVPRERIDLMLRALWDVGPHSINYFYFDENCSYIILMLLEIADPRLDVVAQFDGWVTPADTLRAVVRSPGLLREVDFRPSARFRFRSRYTALSDEQQGLLRRLFSADFELALSDLESLEDEDKARVIDAGLEFVDFDEGLAAQKTAEKWLIQRNYFLTLRSKIRVKPAKIAGRPAREDPNRGHGTGRLGLELGGDEDGLSLGLDFMPAIHSLLSSDEGYPPGLSIEAFRTLLHYSLQKEQIDLHQFTLLRILSVEPKVAWLSSSAWTLNIGAEPGAVCDGQYWTCMDRFVRFGRGEAISVIGDRSLMYLLVVGQIGVAERQEFRPYGGPGLEAGLLLAERPDLRMLLSAFGMRRFGVDGADFRGHLRLGVSKTLSRDFEIRIEARREPSASFFGLGFHRYY